MPSNSNNSINKFSPNFRDSLLARNLLSDTVKSSSLSVWLDSINKPVQVVNPNGMYIQSSPDIEVEGPVYRGENSKFNKNQYITLGYTNLNIPYNSVDIEFPSVDYAKYSTAPISSPTTDGPLWRDTENTIFNIFKAGNKEYYGNGIISYKDTDIITNTAYLTTFGGQNEPELDAVFRRELSVTQNQYKSPIYDRVDFVSLPFETNPALAVLNLNPNVYAPTLEAYTSLAIPASGPFLGGDIRQFNTTKNMYLDVPKQTRTVIDTSTVIEQHTSYIDYNNAFLGGAESTQLVNVIGSALGGGGVGFDPNSGAAVPDFDVRSSLAGRALTAGGKLDDTRLGQISPRYLAAAIGNNIAFNIKEETIGRVNTSLASLAGGGSLIAKNNRITVGNGFFGVIGNILERMTGAKYPSSSLDADIFSFDKKSFIGVPNISRANDMLKNTGSGTADSLFKNINANTTKGLLGKRGGYAPIYTKSRKGTTDGEGSGIYAFSDRKGGVIDMIGKGDENSPVAQSSHKLSGIITSSGFGEGPTNVNNSRMQTKDGGLSDFIWSDTKWNKLARETSSGDPLLDSLESDLFGKDFTVSKSILFKTQELFNSGKMRTLVNGKGIFQTGLDETSTTKQGYMSKGSAVLKGGGTNLNPTESPDEIFVRAWSPVDRYDQYKDLQKHSALDGNGRVDDVDVESSVLGLNGIVKIAPHKNNNIKKFMFSIENLAWNGQQSRLIECEKGPGDLLSGTKGRIMWFPPYEMVINESTSANWERNNFIGRGEPIYTYNNTERTGTLGFKIVVDHPNYLNFMKGRTDDEISAFFAGALDIESIRNNVLTDDEKEDWEIINKNKTINGVPPKTTPTFEFEVFFPNSMTEVADIDEYTYEDGKWDVDVKVIEDEDGNYTFIKSDIPYELYQSGIKYYENSADIEEAGGNPYPKNVDRERSGNWPNNTNFALNGIKSPIVIPELGDSKDKLTFNGWNSIKDNSDIINYFTKGNCKFCKFDITGYASSQGPLDVNLSIAKSRAQSIKDYIVDTFNVDVSRIKVAKPEPPEDTGCADESSVDSYGCKSGRRVIVKVQFDEEAFYKENKRPAEDPNEPKRRQEIPLSRFYTECDYFEQIGLETDSFISRDIKSKIKNFHPAFHSTTPEGFNSRLTFLQQCMRQGPSFSENNPDNLAFGTPPVCILRIGDFYHTKIIIESLTIDYEPLVWDLNPEGVGVQPMIANINLSFAFIGGSSLKGPINRLQNAISFNYFANTELYDPRAERIREKTTEEKNNVKLGKSGYIIQEGRFPFSENTLKDLAATALDQKEREDLIADEKAKESSLLSDLSDEEKALAILENNENIIRGLSLRGYDTFSADTNTGVFTCQQSLT